MKSIVTIIAIMAISVNLSAQPILITDINQGKNDSYPTWITEFNGKLHFLARDAQGLALWNYDGNSIPMKVAQLNNWNTHPYTDQHLNRKMVEWDNKLHFICVGFNSTGAKLHEYDGVNPPSEVNGILNPFSDYDYLCTINGKAYFHSGSRLYEYDPATNNTVLINKVYNKFWSFKSIAQLDKRIYFSAQTNMTLSGEDVLGYYDPTTDVAQMVFNSALYPRDLTAIGNKLYFAGYTAQHGYELYSFDHFVATRLTDLAPGNAPGIRVDPDLGHHKTIITYNNKIYFCGTDGTLNSISGYNYYLCSYDSATQTASVVDKINTTGNAHPLDFHVHNNRLYFTASDGIHGTELWEYDGVNLKQSDVFTGSDAGCAGEFTSFKDALYFMGNDGISGFELFRLNFPLNISKEEISLGLTVYPNPSDGNFSLSLNARSPSDCVLEISSLAGQVLHRQRVSQNSKATLRIELGTELPDGMYLLSVYSEHGKQTTKLIINQ